MKRAITFGLVVSLLSGLMFASPSHADEPSQQAMELDVTIQVRMRYLISLPEDYSADGKPVPLLLFLHGAGERGSDLNKVKKHGPPKLIEGGKSMPFLVVSPQCESGQRWEPYQLTALLDEVIRTHNVDESRVYLSGLSMGGFGTWALAAYTPDRFAAIAPICGGGESFLTRQIKDVPIWVFHGAKDSVVPLERSEVMVEALKKAGGEPRFTVYPDAEHDSWTETYNNPELYTWLLSHQKN
ncbi:prolyl oligopeptidase family serine peptidase [Rhodopirellula sp. MGV]|uniref:carboxylesterase family protein n=1 Tax=Rhodopirellula sp. MGV TaxID=2023130 RepID=UPI000B968CC5|nr:prolyl oligopeptidase family serine peptidase [Rhodopirellula sp. MGV]OYP31151.1 phospholipase [Rhodopirellula sp. MGV]PNY36025.1 phospholipase [Rhodopirellula baltica]